MKLLDYLSNYLTTGTANFVSLTEVQQQQALAALSAVSQLKAPTTEPTKLDIISKPNFNSI